jgi:hypothetical protein
VPRTASKLILAASAIACVLTIALWLRSLWRSDLLFLQRMQQVPTPSFLQSHNEIWISSGAGNLGFGWSVWRDDVPHPRKEWTRIARTQPTAFKNHFQLRATWRGNPFRTMWMSSLVLPYPLILAGFSLPWLVWHRRRSKRKRNVAMNLCQNCGYDLRASPQRCPECGTVVASV